jgi:predicted Zn-dependent peptidase
MKLSPKLRYLTLMAVMIAGCTNQSEYSQAGHMLTELDAPKIVTQPENIANFFLENGLEVVAIRNAASPMVGLNLVVQVGSAYEDYRTSGMSHMLEHLLFNGSTKRTQAELYAEVDRLGAYSNAHTDKYFTDYILLFPTDKLDAGMDIQTDMVFNSILPKEKFEKERGIVIEEIRQGRDREGTGRDIYFDRINYGPTGVGLPTLGTISTITNLSRDITYEFYKKHYVPNNMVLIVVGNFEPDEYKLFSKPPPLVRPVNRPTKFWQRCSTRLDQAVTGKRAN